jgi:muramidase (phage lysozyme)
MGPLSNKERREDYVVSAKQVRENVAASAAERRKEELHRLKLQGEAAKYGVPAPKPAAPQPAAPLSAAAVAGPTDPVQAGDVVPTMLTPGEAVIPAPAAQDPANKGIIQRLVAQGRGANDAVRGLMQHFIGGAANAIPQQGGVQNAARAVTSGRGRQIEDAERKSLGLADGTTSVPFVGSPLSAAKAQQGGAVQYLSDGETNVKRFLHALSKAEGADYDTVVGGGKFTDYTQHPRIVGLRTKEGPSTAAGRYQITGTTYDEFAKKLGVQGFSPEVQDKIALSIIEQEGALEDIQKGDFSTAVGKLGGRWASLPSSKYSQPKRSMDWFNKQLTEYDQSATPAAGSATGPEAALLDSMGITAPAPKRGLVTQAASDVLAGKGPLTALPSEANKRPLKPEVALRRAGMLAADEPAYASLSIGDFNQIKERDAKKALEEGQAPTGKPPLNAAEKINAKLAEETAASEEQDTPEARAARIQASLDEPNIRNRLQVLQEQDQAQFGSTVGDPNAFVVLPSGEKVPAQEARKSFLEEGLAAIFGDKGMFNKEDLVRFSVLAAGGLLTGGSIAGSVRYAGRDTIQHSDRRRALESAERKAQATAQANMQKELRADLRRLDAESIKALDKKAPDIQSQAVSMMNRAKALEMEGKYEASRELYRNANIWLTRHPDVPTGDAAKSGSAGGYKDHDSGLWRGKPAVFRASKDGTVYEVQPDGAQTWLQIKNPGEFEKQADHDKNLAQIEASTQRLLEARLRPMYKKNVEGAAVQAKGLATGFAALRHELGRHVSPQQFAQMAEITIGSLTDDDIVDGRISQEALRRSFMVNGVMQLKKGDVKLVRDGKGKVDVTLHGYFKDMLDDRIAANKDDPNYGLSKASDEIIAEWDALDPAEQKRYETSATKDGRKGATGFLYWIQQQREKPPKM